MKKFEKIFLHVGHDKTGSTSIQSFFNHARGALKKIGILYPSGIWHAELGSCFSEKPEEYIFNIEKLGETNRDVINRVDKKYLDNFVTELENSKEKILVLSYEGFVYMPTASLQNFKNFLQTYSDEIIVVAYARSPVSYAVSGLSQLVKQAKSIQDKKVPVFSYKKLFGNLASVFRLANLNIRKFAKKSMPQGNVILDFLSVLGVEEDFYQDFIKNNPFSLDNSNTSLSLEAFLIGNRIIEIGKNHFESEQEYMRLFRRNIEPILEGIKGKKLALTEEQAQLVFSLSKNNTDYLKENFNIEFDTNADLHLIGHSNMAFSKQQIETIACEIDEAFFSAIEPNWNLFSQYLLMQYNILLPGHQENNTSAESDRRVKGYVLSELTDCTLKPNQSVEFKIEIGNNSDVDWLGDNGQSEHPVRISYHFLDSEGVEIIFDGARTLLPESGIPANQFITTKANIVMPNKPGNYTLVISLVEEGISWFETMSKQFIPAFIDVCVQ